MQNLIILSALTSILNDFINRYMFGPQISSYITLSIIVIMIFTFIIKSIKSKSIKKYSKIYIIIYLTILAIVMQMVLKGINITMIKFIFYNFVIIILVNKIDGKIINKIYLILVILSVILSIEVIIKGILLEAQGIHMRNLRNYTFMDKQAYNIFYNLIIPISIVDIFYNKNIIKIIVMLINIFSCIFMLQIKSILFTVPLAIIIFLILVKKINFTKLIKFSILTIIPFVFIVSIVVKNIELIPSQIRVPIQYFILDDKDNINSLDLKDIDTFIMRREIYSNAISIFKDNLLFGIGYGNYSEYVEGKKIISEVTGRIYTYPNVTESGMLNFIVEGGIIGGILHFSLIITIISRIKNIQINKESATSIIIFLCFILSNIIQDNLSYIYWLVLSIAIIQVLSKNQNCNYV